MRKGKLDLGRPVHAWVDDVRAIPRLVELPLTTDIALLADNLVMHPDPADRFIAATALHHQASLLSKDRLMRKVKDLQLVW